MDYNWIRLVCNWSWTGPKLKPNSSRIGAGLVYSPSPFTWWSRWTTTETAGKASWGTLWVHMEPHVILWRVKGPHETVNHVKTSLVWTQSHLGHASDLDLVVPVLSVNQILTEVWSRLGPWSTFPQSWTTSVLLMEEAQKWHRFWFRPVWGC